MDQAMNDRFLDGHHALVTGSTSGIGLGIARAFARRGCALTLNGFGEPDAIAATCEELANLSGAPVAHHPADMRDPAQIEAMMDEAKRDRGTMDVLVNNAGIQHVAPIGEFPVD